MKKQKKEPERRFPMRINQYLAWQKQSTRREADELIKRKSVLINGRIAVLGDKVIQTDKVEMTRKIDKKYSYYTYNKPIGEITGEHKIKNKEVFPLGRLDKDSEGLMILTDDGRITDRLLNPEYEHEKEYIVTVAEKLRPNFKERMESGVNIEGYITRPCKVTIINDYTFRIVLTEGKKHQIRRMCAALFNQVRSLKRIRIMNIELKDLLPGRTRELGGRDLEIFLKKLLSNN